MKTKVSVETPNEVEQTKPMGDIEYGEVCQVLEGVRKDDIAIRASTDTVIILNDFHNIRVEKGYGSMVKPLPVGTKVVIEVLKDEPYFGFSFCGFEMPKEATQPMSKKERALKHYYKMKEYVLTQPPGERASFEKMEKAIGENWGGDYCPYCESFDNITRYCKLASQLDHKCLGGVNCCNGLWKKLDGSCTWREWIERVDAVIMHIEIHG